MNENPGRFWSCSPSFGLFTCDSSRTIFPNSEVTYKLKEEYLGGVSQLTPLGKFGLGTIYLVLEYKEPK